MVESSIRLYVKGVKTVTGFVRARESGWWVMGPGRPPGPRGARAEHPECESVLPEDQQKVVEIVREIARRHSLEVEVVDVTRENVLRRVIQEEREKIKAFPALLADSGGKD